VNSWAVAAFALPACALLLYLWARYVEPRWLSHETREVAIPGLPPALDGFRVSVLSDLHYPRWSDDDFIRRAVVLSNAARPDVVFLLGDLCDRSRHEPKTVPYLGGVLSGIENKYGVYAVLGNHDYWLDADGIRAELARSTSVCLLDNASVLLNVGGASLAVAGVGDSWLGYADPATALAGIPDDVPRLLLSHNPDLAEELPPGPRADLQISGHTHGGQVRIPFGPAPRVPSRYGNKYRAGLVRGPRHPVYVNRGLCSIRNVRFWCRPEVTLLVLRRAPDEAV
jgi:uncharacterized protein